MTQNGAIIDKLALIEIQNKKVLVALSKGKTVWYIPGGKREQGESDAEALIRECKEELTIEIDPDSLNYFGTFESQAHDKPTGTIVRMTCYTARFEGKLRANEEIAMIDFFEYSQREHVAPVDKIIMDDLFAKGLIS